MSGFGETAEIIQKLKCVCGGGGEEKQNEGWSTSSLTEKRYLLNKTCILIGTREDQLV